MSAIALHLMMGLADGRVIARSNAERRIVASAVARFGRDFGLTSFRLVDTHIHTLNNCERGEAGRFSRKVKISIKRQLGLEVGFAPTNYVPVLSQRHLSNAFTYSLNQDRRHGCFSDPHHDGSILPDLLGLRLSATYAVTNVRMLLPRVNRDQLFECLGVEVDLDGAVESFACLAEATAAAVGLPDLSGRSRRVVEAVRGAVQAVGTALTTSELARLLGRSRSTIRNARGSTVDPQLVRAIQRQLRFRRALAQGGGADEPLG